MVDCLNLGLEVKPLVMAVNGYGTILNSPLGQVYLPRVKRAIEEHRPEMVIFCGGYTFAKSMPSDSEASIMAGWMREHLDPAATPRLGYRTENNSYTALGNSQGAAYFMEAQIWRFWRQGRGYYRLIHCCEATRAANVVMLDRHFMIDEFRLVSSIDDITIETASWEQADPLKQAVSMFHNRMAIRFPTLGFAERERKRRIAASQHR